MTNIKRYTLLITLFLLTTSCGYLGNNKVVQNRDREYLTAKSAPPLKVPPGLSASSIQTTYPVSDQTYPDNAKQVDLVPPELNPK